MKNGSPMDRRYFLFRAGALVAATQTSRGQLRRGTPVPSFSDNPFTLGVASGDPAPGGFVLWTRLARDPLHGGGMPHLPVDVHWQVAEDEGMQRVVQKGTSVATPSLGHSVHVEVEGLRPDRWYWYRFWVAGEESVVGRSRTAPTAGNQDLAFAVASCQHYEHGLFTAYRHMAEQDLDLVIHLGDYIYEGGGRNDRVRRHTGLEIQTVADYRNRYALYRTDPDLQKAHARFPWIVTWDDHEVDNNYADLISEDHLASDIFARRRASAYQVYYEHMPLRAAQIPSGPDLQLFRQIRFGDLVNFHVLDTRQYRSDQPCEDVSGAACEGVFDPAAGLLGQRQENWLLSRLGGSGAGWNVLAQQVMMNPVDRDPGELRRTSRSRPTTRSRSGPSSWARRSPREAMARWAWSDFAPCRARTPACTTTTPREGLCVAGSPRNPGQATTR